MNFRLFVPQRAAESHHIEVGLILDRLKRDALDTFGGYTLLQGHGGWRDADGFDHEEPVLLLDIDYTESQSGLANWFFTESARLLLDSGELAIRAHFNGRNYQRTREGLTSWV